MLFSINVFKRNRYLSFHSNSRGINDQIVKYFTNQLTSSSSTTEPQGRKFLSKQRGGGSTILKVLKHILLVLSVCILGYEPAALPCILLPIRSRVGLFFFAWMSNATKKILKTVIYVAILRVHKMCFCVFLLKCNFSQLLTYTNQKISPSSVFCGIISNRCR